mgnify:FL=1
MKPQAFIFLELVSSPLELLRMYCIADYTVVCAAELAQQFAFGGAAWAVRWWIDSSLSTLLLRWGLSWLYCRTGLYQLSASSHPCLDFLRFEQLA